MTMVRVVIFDRDGTLIEHVPYLSDPDKVVLMSDAQDALRRLIDCGMVICLHTNQSGVGRGLFEVKDAEACNAKMLDLLQLGPNPFFKLCVAYEAPDAPAIYRKPSPRFAIELIEELNIDASEIVYIGDRALDLITAVNAGATGIGVCTGLFDLRSEVEPFSELRGMQVVPTLTHAVDLILGCQDGQ